MTNPSTSFASLLQEIEAIPEEHWTDLLSTLQQFRQNISANQPVTTKEQPKKNQVAIDLMNAWIQEDNPEEQQKSCDALEKALDIN